MRIATALKVGPSKTLTLFALTLPQVILPLALLVDGTISTPIVNERADAPGEATFQVYTSPNCNQTGAGKYSQQSKIYQLPDRVCVDTPPVPKVDARFLSYKTKINDGVKASSCFFDVYPEKNCTGNYSGFESAPENSDKCQNVLQGFTGLRETYGAKSVRVSCRTPAPA